MSYRPKTAPRPHQQEALDKALGHESFAYLMGPGTGKSKLIIDEFGYYRDNPGLDACVVLAPAGVHRQWVDDQIPAHANIAGLRAAYWRTGTKNKDFWAAVESRDPVFLGVNLEMLSTDSGEEVLTRILKARPASMLVADESHKFRSPSSKRTRRLWALSNLAPYRRILSGSSVSQGLEDLYAPFRFLDWKIIGCSTAAEYRARYCEIRGEWRKIVGYKNKGKLFGKMDPYCYIRSKKDCQQYLPEQLFLRRMVEMSSAQRKAYHDLRTVFLTELATGEIIDAPLAITRLQKMQQITGGHVSLGEGQWAPLPCPKLEAALDIVHEAEGKVIIWCQWGPDVQQLLAALEKEGVGAVGYWGGVPKGPVRDGNLARFKMDDETKVLVATQATGGAGLTINEAHTTIFYSNSFKYDDREQAESRNHREGQHYPVTYYDLVVPGTVDTRILSALNSKRNVADLVHDRDQFQKWLLAEQDDE